MRCSRLPHVGVAAGDTDYAVPPGETLRELHEEQGLTQRDLARRADLSPKHVNRLLQGLVPLSADVAQRLERVTSTLAQIWNRLEANYRSDLERQRTQRDLAEYGAWLRDLPVRALVQRGILPASPTRHDPINPHNAPREASQ